MLQGEVVNLIFQLTGNFEVVNYEKLEKREIKFFRFLYKEI